MSRTLAAPWLTLVMLALAGVSLILHRDHKILSSMHEVRALETAREMMADGDWVVPHLRGRPRLEKPPLAYWASLLAFERLGDPEPGAARLIVGCAGLATLLAAWFLARELRGAAVANLTLGVLAASQLVLIEFRKVTADPYLAAGLTIAAAFWATAMRRDGRRAQILWLLGFAALSLAVLAKGPIALVFAALSIAFIRPATGTRWPSWITWIVGVLIAIGPIVWWGLAVLHRVPDGLAVWKREVGNRLTHDDEDGRPMWTYGGTLALIVLPATLSFALGMIRPADRCMRQVRWWFLAGMAFLLFLSSRKDAYALPLVVPAAIGAAGLLAEAVERGTLLARAAVIVQAAATAIGVCALTGLCLARELDLNISARIIGAAAVVGAGWMFAWRRRTETLLMATLVTAILGMGLYHTSVKPFEREDHTRRHLGDWVRKNVPAGATFTSLGFEDAVVMFYSRRVPELYDDAATLRAARRGETWTLARLSSTKDADLGSEVLRIADDGGTNPIVLMRWSPRAESR